MLTGILTTGGELIANMRKRLLFEISVEYSGSTPGDQFGIYGDPSGAVKEMGWKAKYSLDQGLQL